MTPDRYASVPERITWTTGFRVAIDKHVLGTLSAFANFRTGRHADMALDTLVARARVPRRTVIRSLRRLEADGWIVARRRHRRPTVYDLCVDRLATHWLEAKLVEANVNATGDQPTDRTDEFLRATGDRLGATGGTQEPVLSATGGTPSPVRTDPQVDPQRTALRAGSLDDGRTDEPTAKPEGAKVPHQLTLGVMGPALVGGSRAVAPRRPWVCPHADPCVDEDACIDRQGADYKARQRG